METLKNQINLDDVVTLAIVELLTNPEYGISWIKELSLGQGDELTDAQAELVDTAVVRTMDQLAIPFIQSLPEAQRAVYEQMLRRRAGYSEQIEEINLP